MAYWIHKLTRYRKQLRLTFPGGLADIVGARKWETVVMYPSPNCKGIIVEEFKGGSKKRAIWGRRAIKDR